MEREVEVEAVLRPGSREDFDLLYQRSYRSILALLYGSLGDQAAAEDCAQETFVRAFRAWPRWRPDAGPEAWLYRIAINTANTYRRKSRLGTAQELIRRIGRPRESRNPEDVAQDNEVLAGLARLPAEQSAALVLRHYHGYSNREIARVLGVPERTIASRLMRAKDRLRRAADWDEPANPAAAPEVVRAGSRLEAVDG